MKAAIFDMDGTILDSGEMWDGVAEAVVRQFGYVPKPTIRQDTLPLGMREFAPFLKADYQMAEPVEEIDRAVEDQVRSYYLRQASLKPGAMAFLQALKAAGVKLAVATATERQFVEPALEAAGALDLFDGIFTCPEVGRGKRHPDVYRAAAGALGADPSCAWVFEDALYAVETAKRGGFRVCAVADAAAAFQRPEIQALADCYLEDFFHWKHLPFAAGIG